MNSISFLSLILVPLISITCALVYKNNPVIAVTQGVIEKDNVLPISVFWYYPNFTEGDLLFVNISNNVMEYTNYSKIESYTGFYELPRTALEHGANPDQYSAWIKSKEGTLGGNSPRKSKIQWMYDRRDILEFFSLRDLVIPGTHQLAAYAKSDEESLNDQSSISRWILCQTKSIKAQLMDGIRYLDLRPSALSIDGKKKYILTHNIFDLISMDDAVTQINGFMGLSKDIVIVSFREFRKGFYSYQDHLTFINYLEHAFERHAHPRTWWNYKLNQFWNADKRLILSYDHYTYTETDFMWPPIMQYWGDAQTIGQLHSYLNTSHETYRNDQAPYAAMAELTHSATTIAQDIFSRDMSLRHWAERLSRYIPRWYTEEWNSTANIVAVDFYQTSGIVDIAIQLNEERAEDPYYILKKSQSLP